MTVANVTGREKIIVVGVSVVLFLGLVFGVMHWQTHYGDATLQSAHVADGVVLIHERTGGTRRGAGPTDRLVALDLATGKERKREIVGSGSLLAVRGKTAMFLESDGIVVRELPTLAITMTAVESRRRFGETALGREACGEADGSAVRFTRADAKYVRVSLDDLEAVVVDSDRCTSTSGGPRWDLGDVEATIAVSSLGRDATTNVALVSTKDSRQLWVTPLDWKNVSVKRAMRAGDRLVVANNDGSIAVLEVATGRVVWQRTP